MKNKFQIKIEYIDNDNNILYHSQCIINPEMMDELKNKHNIDILEEAFKQLKTQIIEKINENK